MPPPPQTPAGKKSKKARKPQVLSLQAFLASQESAPPRGTVLKKRKNLCDAESDESSGSPVVYELPTVPLCERRDIERKQPYNAKKQQRPTEQVLTNWRTGSSNVGYAKPSTEGPAKPTGAIRKQYKQEERPSRKTDEKADKPDLSSWRTGESITVTNDRPKLKLQPRSLPLPSIVRLPEVTSSGLYPMPEPEDVKITIKKRLIDDHDRDGVPCDSVDKMGDRMRSVAESMDRMHLYLSKDGDDGPRGSAAGTWRRGEATKKRGSSSDSEETGKEGLSKSTSSSNESSEA